MARAHQRYSNTNNARQTLFTGVFRGVEGFGEGSRVKEPETNVGNIIKKKYFS